MSKKFELIESDFVFTAFGVKLFRIRALIDIPLFSVKKGDKGGFVEKEENLSHENSAWVYDNAQVSGSARVSSNAWVYDNAQVSGSARVSSNARVSGSAWVSDNAWVSGSARVSDNAWVYDNAQVSGSAWVSGSARVSDNAWVSGSAQVSDNAWVSGSARVSEKHQSVSVTNLRWSLTSLPIGIQVGCKFHTFKEWKEKHLDLGKKQGLSPELSNAYFNLMKSVRKIQRLEHLESVKK